MYIAQNIQHINYFPALRSLRTAPTVAVGVCVLNCCLVIISEDTADPLCVRV